MATMPGAGGAVSQVRKTPYTSVSVTPEAVAALRWLSVFMSASVGEKLSMSDAVLTAKQLAMRHDLSIEDCAKAAGVTQ